MANEGADALAVDTVVGGYAIAYRIGGGGMGTVYAAEEPTIKKRVAIKVLRHALADDASVVARFEREARAANDVRHPAIVDVFAFGKLADGRPYLIMSLLEGRSLSGELAARGRIPAAEAWAWARELGEALAVAHAAGIVHRDLKPDNVFLERFDGKPPRIRLFDLGLVKLMPGADEAALESAGPMKLTQSGVPMGTPAYMAPEQWWGQEIDGRVDQYALGVTLFEMLTGRPPFRSQQYIELAQQHLHEAPPTLASLGCAASPELEAFLARALAKAPDDRFTSMADLVARGDAAFSAPAGAELATAETLLSDPANPGGAILDVPTGALAEKARTPELAALEEAARPAWSARFRRFALALAILLVGGPAALVAVGYAGASSHDVRGWLRVGGPTIPFIVIAFVPGAVALAWAARRRARSGTPSLVPWVFALATALAGAVGTYTGWAKTATGVEHLAAPARFEILHEGVYELGLSRFLGFFLASLLLAGIAGSAGLFGSPRAEDTLLEALGVRRWESVAAALCLLGLAAAAVALGAPSGALAASLAAAIVAFDLALPPLAARTAARDELERAVAGLLGLALVLAVAMARVEAREAALWMGQPTRAARVAELVAVAAERSTTLWLGLAALLVFVAATGLRLRRVWRRVGPKRPTAATLALFAVVAAVAAGDVVQHARFASARERVHAELAPEFSLFARLEPPSAGEVDPKRYPPHPAPALQLTRSVVAVNARPVAPLGAADSADGAMNIGRDLSHALAEHAATASDESIDLAVSIDREVPWSTVIGLLGVARRAGARRLDLLLTRGPSSSLPEGAPPEASWVLARDFVALRVELADDGFRTAGGQPFGAVAPELVRLAEATDAPITLATAPR